MAERNMNDDFVYRNQVGTAIDVCVQLVVAGLVTMIFRV